MSLISDNANQLVTLERLASEDARFHEARYGGRKTISAVYEPASGSVRTQNGTQVNVESRVVSTEAIALGDKIEGSEVVRVVSIIDFDGTTVGYEAFL